MEESPTISLIAALGGESRVIGKDGKLPWKIKRDLQHFKRLTTGHPIIMGRKTFESIGRPLPSRTNIIVTRNTDFSAEGAIVAHSLDEALKKAGEYPGGENIFVIGGGEIYKQALPLADTLYLTLVEGEFDGDAFFPDFSDFDDIVSEEKYTEDDYSFTFTEIERKK